MLEAVSIPLSKAVAVLEAMSTPSNKEIDHCTLYNGKIKDNHLHDHLISCTEEKSPSKTCGKTIEEKKSDKKRNFIRKMSQSKWQWWWKRRRAALTGRAKKIKKQSPARSNEDKSVNEKEKYSVKPVSCSS